MAGLHTNPHPEPLRSSPVGLPLQGSHLRNRRVGAGGGGDHQGAGGGGVGSDSRRINVKINRLLASGAVAVALFVATVGGAFAQEPTPSDDEVNVIARQLYCPVCENVPLDVCPTQACEQWRATIREKLGLGWTEQQIKDYFVAQYGDRVLAAPPPRGLNWLVYLLPPLVLIGGGLLLWQTMRRWRRAAEQAPTPAALSETDPYVQRLEEELKRRG